MLTRHISILASGWKRLAVGIGAALAITAPALGVAVAASLSPNVAEAQRLQEADKVVRTQRWLVTRNLDPSSSVDMMRALILACDEIKTRGAQC